MRLALANSLSAHRPPPVGGPLSGILAGLGLTDGLKLCLDAGDADSYTSGQSWLDRSGNGHDFFLGADGNATATDPTFTGTAGGLSSGEYWAFDGGDYFTYDTTNEPWMQNLHKDNAKAWGAAWIWPGATATQGIFGNNVATNTNIGFCWSTSSLNSLVLTVTNGSAAALSQNSGSTNTIVEDQWNFTAFTIDEAVGASGLTFIVNDVTIARTSTYTSPSSSDASFTSQIGTRGNNNSPLSNTSRLAMLCMGEGAAPTAAQLLVLRSATRGRFGV